MLNDKNRKPFSDPSDERSTFFQNMASMFKEMDMHSPSTKVRKLSLISDTSDVLHITLYGISYLISKLVPKIKCVSTVEIQSDESRENLAFTDS